MCESRNKAFSKQALSLGSCDHPSWWDSNDGSEGLVSVADQPDQWEAYVRRWVMRRTNHSAWHVKEPLTDAQRTTAKGILDECRNKAVPIRTRLDKETATVAADITSAEAALTALQSAKDKVIKKDSSSPETKIAALDSAAKKETAANEHELNDKIKALQQRKAELAKSPEIERIFDELKSRLDGMLTSKQKDPANASFQRPTPPPLPQRPFGSTSRPAGPASIAPRP